jgi:hypothetical protein
VRVKNHKQVLGFMNHIAKCDSVCDTLDLYCQAESLCYPSYHIITQCTLLVHMYGVFSQGCSYYVQLLISDTNNLKLFLL